MSNQFETFVQKRDRLLLDWHSKKATLAAAKEAEMALRNEITQFLFPNPVKGTQRVDLGDGYAVKLVYKLNYNLPPDTDIVDKTIDQMNKFGNEGPMIAERLFKWKPDVSITEYNLLSERATKFANDPYSFPEYKVEAAILAELNKILTIKPASPTLELEEPKVKK